MILLFEGVDGSGKTSVAQAVRSALGDKAEYFSDPSKEIPAALAIRQELFSGAYNRGQQIALFKAARIILENRMSRSIYEGNTVILDRYWPSTVIYQLSELPNIFDKSKKIFDLIQNAFRVDHTFLFTANAEVVSSRLRERGDLNKYDSFSPAVVQKRSDQYKHLLNWTHKAGLSSPFSVIDTTSKTIEEVTQEVLNIIKEIVT